jgi:hypothetical protein
MGTKVCGRKPDSEVGRYFRRSIWGWPRLADYCIEAAPDIAARCKYWHSNGGGGSLSKKDSKLLPRRLRGETESGVAVDKVRVEEAMFGAHRDSGYDSEFPCLNVSLEDFMFAPNTHHVGHVVAQVTGWQPRILVQVMFPAIDATILG